MNEVHEWAVIGPDNTVHYRRNVGYYDSPLFEVLENRPKGYWLRRDRSGPSGQYRVPKTRLKRSVEEVARLVR